MRRFLHDGLGSLARKLIFGLSPRYIGLRLLPTRASPAQPALTPFCHTPTPQPEDADDDAPKKKAGAEQEQPPECKQQ